MAAAILKAMSTMVGENTINTPALQFTIGDKIVATLSSNGITSENKTIRTPPPSRPFKVGVFLVFNRWLEQRHNVAWRGQGRKRFIFPLLSQQDVRDALQDKVSQLILWPIVGKSRVREREKIYITPTLHFRVSSSTALNQSACKKSLCYCKI